MRFSSVALGVLAFVGIAVSGDTFDVAAQDAGDNLTKQYREARGEIEKRDLALKLMDAGVLRKHQTTEFDVARIFGADWTPNVDVGKYESYGIVYFAKQPKGPNYVQVPRIGWYLVIHYDTKEKIVRSWILSDNHK